MTDADKAKIDAIRERLKKEQPTGQVVLTPKKIVALVKLPKEMLHFAFDTVDEIENDDKSPPQLPISVWIDETIGG